MGTLEHVSNPQKTLQELIRLTKRYVIINVPLEKTWPPPYIGPRLLAFTGRNPHYSIYTTYHYSLKDVCRMVTNAGLLIRELVKGVETFPVSNLFNKFPYMAFSNLGHSMERLDAMMLKLTHEVLGRDAFLMCEKRKVADKCEDVKCVFLSYLKCPKCKSRLKLTENYLICPLCESHLYVIIDDCAIVQPESVNKYASMLNDSSFAHPL